MISAKPTTINRDFFVNDGGLFHIKSSYRTDIIKRKMVYGLTGGFWLTTADVC